MSDVLEALRSFELCDVAVHRDAVLQKIVIGTGRERERTGCSCGRTDGRGLAGKRLSRFGSDLLRADNYCVRTSSKADRAQTKHDKPN